MKKGFPLGGSCPRSGLMRGNAANIDYLYLPHTRPHPALRGPFSLRAKSRLRRLRSDTRLRAQPLGGRLRSSLPDARLSFCAAAPTG